MAVLLLATALAAAPAVFKCELQVGAQLLGRKLGCSGKQEAQHLLMCLQKQNSRKV